VHKSFGRFWNEEHDFCFDVIDGLDSDDPVLRCLAPSRFPPT
jgi:hypothetical protein